MTPEVRRCSVEEILPMRELYREEMNCQITHDSISRREGWTLPYLLTLSGAIVGYALLAIGGPWTDKPTVIEYYVAQAYRTRVFDLFAAFVAASGAQFIEIQTNATLLTVMLHLWSPDAVSEKIVFHDGITTVLPSNRAILRRVTSVEESLRCVERRQGSSEWALELDGKTVATGGIAFHYNCPYGDIYMEVSESYRRRGLGSYLVQELKRSATKSSAATRARGVRPRTSRRGKRSKRQVSCRAPISSPVRSRCDDPARSRSSCVSIVDPLKSTERTGPPRRPRKMITRRG